MVTRTTSPPRRYSPRPAPTPDGVPVVMTSPGSSVTTSLAAADQLGDRADHVGGGLVLLQLAVHPQPQPQVLRVRDTGTRG